jgi:hypothetical protein
MGAYAQVGPASWLSEPLKNISHNIFWAKPWRIVHIQCLTQYEMPLRPNHPLYHKSRLTPSSASTTATVSRALARCTASTTRVAIPAAPAAGTDTGHVATAR